MIGEGCRVQFPRKVYKSLLKYLFSNILPNFSLSYDHLVMSGKAKGTGHGMQVQFKAEEMNELTY